MPRLMGEYATMGMLCSAQVAAMPFVRTSVAKLRVHVVSQTDPAG